MKPQKIIKKCRVYLFLLVICNAFLPISISHASSVEEQMRMLDMLDMMDSLDQQDQDDFDGAAKAAKACITARDYSCATNKINTAKQFAYNDSTQQQVKNLHALLTQEKQQEQKEQQARIEAERRAQRLAEERRRQEQQNNNQASAWAAIIGSTVLAYGGHQAGLSGEQTANMIQSYSNDVIKGDANLSGLRGTVNEIQNEENRKHQEQQRRLRAQQEQQERQRADEQRRKELAAQEEQRRVSQATQAAQQIKNDRERQQRLAQEETARKAREAENLRLEKEREQRLAKEKAEQEAKRQREKQEREQRIAREKAAEKEKYINYLTTQKNSIRLAGIKCLGKPHITGTRDNLSSRDIPSTCIDVDFSVRCPNSSTPYTRSTAHNYVGGASCFGDTYPIDAPSCDIKNVIVKVERVTSCGGTLSSR